MTVFDLQHMESDEIVLVFLMSKLAGGLQQWTTDLFWPWYAISSLPRAPVCQTKVIKYVIVAEMPNHFALFQSLSLLIAICTSQSHKERRKFLFMCSKVTGRWAISFNGNSNSENKCWHLEAAGAAAAAVGEKKGEAGGGDGGGCVLWRVPLVLFDNSPESLGGAHLRIKRAFQ